MSYGSYDVQDAPPLQTGLPSWAVDVLVLDAPQRFPG